MNNRPSTAEITNVLVANVFVLGTFAYAFLLETRFPDLYYFSVQEDEYLEWATVWAFLIAAIAWTRGAGDFRSTTQRFPWFQYGIALFCVVVAMEEISWGQRLIGYRPPEYFLTENFQQELNFHNIVETDFRKLALSLVIAGFGIALPVAAQFRQVRNPCARVGIVAPSIGLLPAFVTTLSVYVVYPWDFSGEWVELALGLGFVFAAIRAPHERRLGLASQTAVAFVAVFALGLLGAAVTRWQRDTDPALLEAARIEVEAISRDFEDGYAESECNLHKRLYTFVVEHEQGGIYSGSFSALQSQGLNEDRADFFLDPWNSPYWIRDRCDRETNQRTTFVYSFGPNRIRDSSRTEILGDDIGAVISHW